jgi:hypothetical protein
MMTPKMTPGQRSSYFLLWADVCAAQKWNAKDRAKRNEVTARCMSEVGGPATDSTTELGEAEITALFCFLTYLKTGDADLDAAARWVDCKQDYKAFSLARQADWHEEKLYGKTSKPNKLDRNRFKGAKTAVGEPLEKFDPAEIKKRHLTLASRHQKKARKLGLPKPKAGSPSVNAPAPAAPAPAEHVQIPANRTSAPAMPAIVAQEGLDGWDGEV